MRIRKGAIRGRVKADLPIIFTKEELSAHGGWRYSGASSIARARWHGAAHGLLAEGAERGFNPHHPKHKSYYPLTAHLAQTSQLLAVHNRPGNAHDSEGALQVLTFLVNDAREQLSPRHLEARLDGAFVRRKILDFLESSGVEYAIKAPLWDRLGIRDEIRRRRR